VGLLYTEEWSFGGLYWNCWYSTITLNIWVTLSLPSPCIARLVEPFPCVSYCLLTDSRTYSITEAPTLCSSFLSGTLLPLSHPYFKGSAFSSWQNSCTLSGVTLPVLWNKMCVQVEKRPYVFLFYNWLFFSAFSLSYYVYGTHLNFYLSRSRIKC
jgi:hypothetical protein